MEYYLDYFASGASHMDELYYLFCLKSWEHVEAKLLENGSKNYTLMQQMVELWTNFATTGYYIKLTYTY